MDRAICIGLTNVNPASYGGWDGDCPGCDLDAKRMDKLFSSYGWETTLVMNEQATIEKVIQTIIRESMDMASGDQLLIYISCHGGQVKDENGDEEDGQDETICLWDGQLLDDQLLDIWGEIPLGVDVVFFTDCCNARTNYKLKPRSIVRSIPAFSLTGIIHLAGCDDGASSYGGDDGGVFTNAWLEVFKPSLSWAETFFLAKDRMPRNQEPFLEQFGYCSPAFIDGPIIRSRAVEDHKDKWYYSIYKWWKELRESWKDDGAGAVTPTEPPVSDTPDTPAPSKLIASFLFDGAKERGMNLLGMSESHWKEVVDRMIANGSNTFYILTQNEADGGNAGFSLFKGNDIGGQKNADMVHKLDKIIEYIRDRKKNSWIELWLRTDDSPNFNRVSPDRQKKAQDMVVNLYDGRVDSYCLGLELNEYMKGDDGEKQMMDYLRHLRNRTDKMLCVHFTSGPEVDKANRVLSAIGGLRGFHAQWSLGKTPAQIKASVQNGKTRLSSGIKYFANEYHQSNDTAESRALGDAALEGGADGVGGGANV